MEEIVGVRWKELPEAGRKAVQAYGVRGLPRDLEWGYTEVPLWWLAHEAWAVRTKRGLSSSERFPSVDEFVATYEICAPTYKWMKRRPGSIWAIILDGPPGGPYLTGTVIEDGCHRFGWYLCHQDPGTMIPVIWGIH